MTYSFARYRAPVMQIGRPPSAFGGLFDEFYKQIDAEQEKACPTSSSITTMRNTADDLERTWNPSGFYTWQQMADVIDATVKLAGHASSAAITFFGGNSTPSAKDAVRKASDKYNEIAKQAIDYTLAWKEGYKTGKPVEAPGFKKWVLDDLRAAADLMRTIEIQVCNQPWWLGTVVGAASFTIGVANTAKRAVGVAVKIGESAIKAVERTGDIVSFLLRWGPYLALGVGGFLVYRRLKKR